MPLRRLRLGCALFVLSSAVAFFVPAHAEPLKLSPVPQNRAAGLKIAAGKAAPNARVPVTVGRDAPLLKAAPTRVSRSSGSTTALLQNSPREGFTW